ncbi:copper resistance system multicopper oxidase [Thermocrinis sp.]|uniref:copper resistance system multicopper oxidase n=1 Tax=Thermocrinis sp. TaxID=2024383 RepID=UPI002FDCBA18
MSWHRRDLLKLMLFSGIAYSVPGFSAFRRLEVVDAREKDELLEYTLVVRKEPVEVGQRRGVGTLINSLLPSPLLRFKEGKEVVIHVINEMDEPTSIHWHGLLVPNEMDGVPGVVFPGIPSKSRFTYRFPIVQYGTYWYHSHSLMQEQLGMYGPLILEPKEEDVIKADRDYVIILSDWTDEDPHRILLSLKKYPGYYNFQKRTLWDFLREAKERGFYPTLKERLMWAKMRMDSRDIADVTGYTYTYLMNGQTTEENPTFIFKPGEKVRLRFINASAATYFDVRIPGLKMTVVQADGQNVYPVDVDEFRIAIAETYDVIVQPKEEKAYAIYAEAMDRSGFVMGTLAPRKGMKAVLPARRKISDLTMEDMGHSHTDHSHHHHHHEGYKMMLDVSKNPFGVDADMVVSSPMPKLDDPGVGLRDQKHKVLTYADLVSAEEYPIGKPERTIEIHLVGNMERFIWRMYSYDGKKLSSRFEDVIPLRYGETVRFVFINHTMMHHPIHLHGMWMYLDNGGDTLNPRKHTIDVKPAEVVEVIVKADAYGNWAFHCHILYHMDSGMFRVVRVS